MKSECTTCNVIVQAKLIDADCDSKKIINDVASSLVDINLGNLLAQGWYCPERKQRQHTPPSFSATPEVQNSWSSYIDCVGVLDAHAALQMIIERIEYWVPTMKHY